jgi:DNA (cytosine-5)-methyltransferase 1
VKHLDLFSGIGGFALAARWVGWETVGFCEIDPYCQKVLRKHWPNVPIYEDIRNLEHRGSVDVITAGFPCQDISVAGKQAGIEGERSGLWSELARVLGEIRPRYAVLENVSNLLSGDSGRWFQRVLGDLAEIGFDAEWHCIPASAVGAPHRRDRVWIVAYPKKLHGNGSGEHTEQSERQLPELGERGSSEDIQHPTHYASIGERIRRGESSEWWRVESDVGRVAHGIPKRVDRLRGLGNAIVPQVAEVIFRSIESQA